MYTSALRSPLKKHTVHICFKTSLVFFLFVFNLIRLFKQIELSKKHTVHICFKTSLVFFLFVFNLIRLFKQIELSKKQTVHICFKKLTLNKLSRLLSFLLKNIILIYILCKPCLCLTLHFRNYNNPFIEYYVLKQIVLQSFRLRLGLN